MSFAQKKTTVTVTKLYFTSDLTTRIDFSWIKEIFPICVNDPVEYAINFDDVKAITTFGKGNRILTFGDLEDIEILDSNQVVVRIGIAGKAFGAMNIFECVVVSPREYAGEKVSILFEWLSSRFCLHYGYQRLLRSDYLTATESKIKRNLFGSITVHVGKIEESWLFAPNEVNLGAIKGIYPVNFWHDKVMDKLERLGFYLPPHCLAKNGVVTFSEAEYVEIYKRNSKYVKYIHFGDTD